MCVHIVTRKKGDLANNDDIYPTLESYDREYIELKDVVINY